MWHLFIFHCARGVISVWLPFPLLGHWLSGRQLDFHYSSAKTKQTVGLWGRQVSATQSRGTSELWTGLSISAFPASFWNSPPIHLFLLTGAISTWSCARRPIWKQSGEGQPAISWDSCPRNADLNEKAGTATHFLRGRRCSAQAESTDIFAGTSRLTLPILTSLSTVESINTDFNGCQEIKWNSSSPASSMVGAQW